MVWFDFLHWGTSTTLSQGKLEPFHGGHEEFEMKADFFFPGKTTPAKGLRTCGCFSTKF